jgi:hypothetical protein
VPEHFALSTIRLDLRSLGMTQELYVKWIFINLVKAFVWNYIAEENVNCRLQLGFLCLCKCIHSVILMTICCLLCMLGHIMIW